MKQLEGEEGRKERSDELACFANEETSFGLSSNNFVWIRDSHRD